MTVRAAAGRGRYAIGSIVLHWLIAALLLWQILIGGTLDGLPRGSPDRPQVFGLHFSLGVSILVLSLARLGWRLANPPPPLPAGMPRWQKWAAHATHIGFYVFLIGMPLTGWAAASGSPRPLPEVFGLIPWFRLPGVEAAPRGMFGFLHTGVLLKLFWALLALHVLGALKHLFMDGDGVVWRMIPVGRRPADA